MTDVDTLRWGDTDSLTFFTTGSGGNLSVKQTKQLVAAKWQRPLTWKLLVNIIPNLQGTGETSTFTPLLQLYVGVGQGMIQVAIPITLAPTAGVYLPVVQFFDIPAEAYQAAFTLDVSGASQETKAETFTFSAFTAPFTEPRGYTDLRDMFRKVHGLPERNEPDREGLPRWMPEGFDDGQLKYRT